jgi:8-oxo-dGTP diphosphatase
MLFVNAEGELLLQLRDDKPEIRHPNHWGTIGGHVEAGETFEQALVREVAEEVELVATGYEYWETHESPGHSLAMFAARLDQPAESLTLHEGQRVEFVSPQAAMMLPLVPWLAEELPRFVRSELYQRLCPEALPPGNAEAASVIFVNRDGELLLSLRGSQPGLPFPSMWDLIGGAMEEGETPEDAAVRETLEELGLVLEDFLYWGDIRGVVLIHVFLAPLDVPAASLALTEGERVAWFEPQAAMALPLVPYMERLIPQFTSTPPYSDLFGPRKT